jgi:O-antigen/teichoic acid export membrane protein
MSSNRILMRNGVLSGLQIALSSLGLLGAYRVISMNLGVAPLGAWTICLSIASLASLFDCGASDALVRQIAQKHANGDRSSASRLFSTAIFMCIAGGALGALVLFLSARHLLSILVAARNQSSFSGFFGSALLVGVLNAPGNSCIGVLEGLERYDLKLAISLGGIILFFIATVVLVPLFGTTGMITAFVVQSAFVLVAALLVVIARLSVFRDNNWRPRASCAAELIRIGLPLKAFGLTSFALEPLTRVLVGSFGGMHAAGTYEVAARAVGQLRGLIVGVAQVSLPRFVSLSVSNPKLASEAESLSIRLTGMIAMCTFGSLVILVPWLSRLLLGSVDRELTNFVFILSFGWFTNTLCAPYFYATVAAGHFRIVWTTTILMAVVNAIGGYFFGLAFGSAGTVLGLSLALTIGSAYIIGTRTKTMKMNLLLQGRPEAMLGVAAVLILIANFGLPHASSGADQVLKRSTYSFAVFLAAILVGLIAFYRNVSKEAASSIK